MLLMLEYITLTGAKVFRGEAEGGSVAVFRRQEELIVDLVKGQPRTDEVVRV